MSETAVIVGHLTILITTLVGFWLQWKREARHHRWQREEQTQMNMKLASIKQDVRNGVGK